MRNFPVQAAGAELLRLAACRLTEAGFQVAALVHDAVLLVVPECELTQAVAQAESLMSDAVAEVFGRDSARAFIPTEATTVCHPDYFPVGRGERVWRVVERLMRRPSVAPGLFDGQREILC